MATILDLPEIRARMHLWTVPEFEKLAQEPAFKRSELIRGIIVEKMSKSPLHAFLTKRLYDVLQRLILEGFTVRQEGPLRLQDSMPEPDISVVRGREEDFIDRHPGGAEHVVEVAITSAAPDRANASLYAEAGVPEYWIVLGELEQVEVYRRPLEGTYQEKRTYRRGEAIECACVEGGTVLVEAIFG